jgi:nitroreductase
MTDNASEKIAFLRGLRAIRQFRAEPIPQDVLNDILEVARWSGSASNRQPWEIVVVCNRETLQALAGVGGYAHHLGGAAAAIILVMAGTPGRFDQETYDEGRLSERIMLAASAYGVGSSIGWFVGDGVAAAKKILAIPEDRLVRTALSLGYPTEETLKLRTQPGQARKPLAAIVHDEHY